MKKQHHLDEEYTCEAYEKLKSISPKNFFDAMEIVLNLVKHRKLSEDSLDASSPAFQYVMEKLNLNPVQVALFAVVLEKGCRNCDNETIASFFGVSNVKLMSYSADFDLLIKNKLVRPEKDNFSNDECYVVPKSVQDELRKTNTYVPVCTTFKKYEDLLVYLDDLLCQVDDNSLKQSDLIRELESVLNENIKMSFVKEFRKMIKKLNDSEKSVFLVCMMLFYKNTDTAIEPAQWNFVFDNRMDMVRFNSAMIKGTSKLLTLGLLENTFSSGMASDREFSLTDVVKRKLFPDCVSRFSGNVTSVLTSPETITTKSLFYNDREQALVDRLYDLMESDHFAKVQENLRNEGLRPGVCILLSGGPGTGKTELVLQLAKKSGRAIYQVDMSELRSKWVGESEKNIQHIFDRYALCAKICDKAPILLFNEADGIINKRMEGAERLSDKSENTIQNIILQNMERFEGIMIATTNLVANMDRAFERRFLFKVQFDNPSLKARESIWHAAIPELSEVEVKTLAMEFDGFSGGQIENVARKRLIDKILGREVSLDEMRGYCQTEHYDESQTQKSVLGFRA